MGMRQHGKTAVDQILIGNDREMSIYTLFGVYMLIKARKSCTWELFINNTFNYGKLASLILFIMVDYRPAAYYTIYILILWLILTNPRYEGPTQIVRLRSKEQFLELIHKPGTSYSTSLKETSAYSLAQKQKQNKNKDFSKMQSTLVIFNASWNDTCYHTFSMWAKWAAKYSTSQLKFGEINVTECDNVARNYKVSTSGMAGHLPTLILFEDGVEYLRFPLNDLKTGKTAYVNEYNETELIKYFDLDKRFLATRDIGLEKKKGAT